MITHFCDFPIQDKIGTDLSEQLKEAGIPNFCSCDQCQYIFWQTYSNISGFSKEIRVEHSDELISREIENLYDKITKSFQEILSWLLNLIRLKDNIPPEIVTELSSKVESYRKKVLGIIPISISNCVSIGCAKVLKDLGVDGNWRNPTEYYEIEKQIIQNTTEILNQRIVQVFTSIRNFIDKYPQLESPQTEIEKIFSSYVQNVKRIIVTELGRSFVKAVYLQMKQGGVKLVNFRLKGNCPLCQSLENRNPWPIDNVPLPIEATHPYCLCFLEIEEMLYTCKIEEEVEEIRKVYFRWGAIEENAFALIRSVAQATGNFSLLSLVRGGVPKTKILSQEDLETILEKRGVKHSQKIPISFYDPEDNTVILIQETLEDSVFYKALPSLSDYPKFRNAFKEIKAFISSLIRAYLPENNNYPPYFRIGLKEAISHHLSYWLIDFDSYELSWLQRNLLFLFEREVRIVINLSVLVSEQKGTSVVKTFFDKDKKWENWESEIVDLGFSISELDLFRDRNANSNYVEIERAISRVASLRKVTFPPLPLLVIGKKLCG